MSKPEAFTPGKPAKIEFVMPDICHTFRTGHRIMVQIQSTWFPLVDRNPQQFEDIRTQGDRFCESHRACLLRRSGRLALAHVRYEVNIGRSSHSAPPNVATNKLRKTQGT